MYIYPIANYNQNFQGLTKKLKNRIYLDGQKDIEEIIESKPNTKPIVGELPGFMFYKLPLENRPQAIADIMDAFGEVSNQIRDFEVPAGFFSMDISEMYRPQSVNKLLTDVLRKQNVISKYDEINLQYLDKGGKGKVFKIEGLYDPKTEDELVIKVFHQIKGEHWHPFKSHGCYAENNNAIYWKNHEGMDTHRGKFFWGDLANGYMITKFLDEDTRAPRRVVDEYMYGIKCTDEEKSGAVNGYNRLKGYNYDYGGMRVVNRLKNSDKICRKTLQHRKKLNPEQRISYWEQEFRESHASEHRRAGLALGIKYMKNKNYYIDRCLNSHMPMVDQALAYVLKYLPHEDAVKYFEKLVQTNDSITQIILFNEVPLLARNTNSTAVIKDDINVALGEIDRDKIHEFYHISKKYAKPDTIEHLASFVALLPKDEVKKEYYELRKIDNFALQDRLNYKCSHIV